MAQKITCLIACLKKMLKQCKVSKQYKISQNIVKTSFIKQTFHRISKTTQKTKPIIQNTKLQSVPVSKTTVLS